jgi:anti-anti-sigma factor
LVGEVDLSNIGVLSEALERELAEDGDLTLDLAHVSFIDSTGVQALFRAAHALGGRGRLILVAPQRRVRTVFGYVLLDSRANVEIRDEPER